MMHTYFKNIYVLAATAFLVFVVLNVAMFFFNMHKERNVWTGSVFAGKVTEVSPRYVSITDVHGNMRTFIITEETKTIEDRNPVIVSRVKLGMYVIVQEGNQEDSHTQAREIRIVSTSPFTTDVSTP